MSWANVVTNMRTASSGDAEAGKRRQRGGVEVDVEEMLVQSLFDPRDTSSVLGHASEEGELQTDFSGVRARFWFLVFFFQSFQVAS